MNQYSNRISTTPFSFRPLIRSHKYSQASITSQFFLKDYANKNKKEKDSHKKLSEQVKRTNNNLRIRRYKQNLRFESKPRNHAKSDLEFMGNECQKVESSCQSRSFSEFMRKKKTENAYMSNKMKVFGNTLTERSKAKVQYEINELLKSDFAPFTQSQGPTDKGKISQMKKYLVCHKILQNLFELMVENPQRISLKTQTPEIYMNLKREMVEVMINEELILEVNRKIEEELKEMREKKFTFNKKKLFQIGSKNPFYLLKERKKDELSDQIEKHLQSLKVMVMSAIEEFNNKLSIQAISNKWDIGYELEEKEDQTRIE